MQRTANENAACLRRICKRSDQPKIERLVNNDARLILRSISLASLFTSVCRVVEYFSSAKDWRTLILNIAESTFEQGY